MSRFYKLLIISLLFASPAFAADPATFPKEGSMKFLGLDTKSSPTQLQDGRAQDLQNVQFTTTFGLKKRNGYSLAQFLDTKDMDISPILGVYYTRLSNQADYNIYVSGSEFFNDDTLIPGAPGVSITNNKNNQFVWVTALDDIIGTNDSDEPLTWTSTDSEYNNLDLTDLGREAPTKVKTLAWFQNFLILANTVESSVEKPTRIRWSNIGTIETWTEADRNDISELGGQEINALTELYNDLYIFLTDSVWKMSFVGGDEQFKFTKVLDKIGCIAKNSVQNIILQGSQRGVIFLTKNKQVYFFNGVTAVKISEIIETTLDDWAASRLPYAVSNDTGEEYRLYGTTGTAGTTNNEVLVFNYRIGEWSKLAGIEANAAYTMLVSNERQTYIGNYDGCILQLDNPALNSDIAGVTGTVTAVDVLTTLTQSGLQVVYDSSASYTISGLIGATVTLTGGTGSSVADVTRVVVDNTTTGLVVDSDFSTTPSTDTTFSLGAIESFYQTKDYDLGDSSRIKSLGELFFWAKEQGNVSLTLTYKEDFTGTVETISVSHDGGGGIWDTAIWGTAIWGGTDALLERVKLKGECRFVNFTITENDIDESFDLYSWNIIFWWRKVL